MSFRREARARRRDPRPRSASPALPAPPSWAAPPATLEEARSRLAAIRAHIAALYRAELRSAARECGLRRRARERREGAIACLLKLAAVEARLASGGGA